MSKIIIIGGGAAGMIAAISAATLGHEVSLYEKNEKLGRKLYITGKGRCNVTNASDMKNVMENVVHNPKFLYSSFKAFKNEDIMQLLENAGCPLKIERGNRVFPVSDKSSDVIKAFSKILNKLNVDIHLNTEVKDLIIENEVCKGIILDKKVFADAVIVATGGLSYQGTGSTGDGYKFAKKAGHTVTKLLPSLVPFVSSDEVCKQLQGLSLEKVEVRLIFNGKEIYKNFGEMLFTHFGVSGPVLLSASSYATEIFKENKTIKLLIDFKPSLSYEKLDARILRDFSENINKSLKNSLSKLFPAKVIPEIIRQAKLDPDLIINSMTKEERKRLVNTTKALEFNLIGLRGFNEAIITRGGVDVREINPKTMESKLVKNLYFAGEVLDVDALTGGYNLQIAWSTGFNAGANINGGNL